LKVSEAAVKRAMEVTPASMARSSPFMFGTRTGYSTPGSFGMLA
jgi:hypothetical protein